MFLLVFRKLRKRFSYGFHYHKGELFSYKMVVNTTVVIHDLLHWEIEIEEQFCTDVNSNEFGREFSTHASTYLLTRV